MAALFAAALSFVSAVFFPEVLLPSFIRQETALAGDGQEIYLEGRIYKIQKKTYYVYVYLKGVKACSEGSEMKRAGSVLLLFDADEFEESGIMPGNKIGAECTYMEFENASNNGNYDEENYYRSLGIFLKCEADEAKIISSSVNLPAQLMYLLKERIISTLEETTGADDEAYGIFCAILTGDKSYLSEETKSLYSAGGISHILAVSGLHISLMGMGLFSMLKKYAGPYKSAAISSAAMLLYCIMCGLSVSCVRAVAMFTVRMAAYFTGKTYDMLSALSLAALIVLSANPFYITNSAFIFSFTAMLTAGVLCPAAEGFLKPESKLSKAVLSSCCMWLGSVPIVCSIYYALPLYGILLNLIAIPLMNVVLAGALAGGAASMFRASFGRFFIGIGYYAVYFINFCCALAARAPFSSIVTGAVCTFRIILFYAVLSVFCFIMKKISQKDEGRSSILGPWICLLLKMAAAAGKKLFGRKKGTEDKISENFKSLSVPETNGKNIYSHRRISRFAAMAAVFILLTALICISPENSSLEIIMFDVDQGDGILIRTPEGVSVMIDGGSTGEDELWKYTLESALEYEGITRIDYCVITHPDSDHISGILDLLNDETTPVYIENLLIPYVPDNENYSQLLEAAYDAGVNVLTLCSGMCIETASVTLSCLHPESGAQYDDVNDYSAVISLEYGSFSALFTGDISGDVELKLAEAGVLGESYDVLKVAHHGSKYSSCEEFLEAVCAKTAIISAGENNIYGHPAAQTLERLADAGAEIYVTADCGEIKISADGSGKVDIWTKF